MLIWLEERYDMIEDTRYDKNGTPIVCKSEWVHCYQFEERSYPSKRIMQNFLLVSKWNITICLRIILIWRFR